MKRELRHGLWQVTHPTPVGGLGPALIVVVLVSLGGFLVPSALVATMAFVHPDYFFTVDVIRQLVCSARPAAVVPPRRGRL